MNGVNATDVTFLSLALADFTAVASYLTQHDYYVAGGLTLLGIILVYLYHKFGSTSSTQ